MWLKTKTARKYVNVSKMIAMSARATASRKSLLHVNRLE